jgi:hypothetical protein
MIAKRTISRATVNDIQEVLYLIDRGWKIMIASGNTHQWDDNHPSGGQISKDIANGDGCLLLEDGKSIATWAFAKGSEPTYTVIYEGSWLNMEPYHVIYRIAGLSQYHGVLKDLLDWYFLKDDNIRIDTHRDNIIMQHCLTSTALLTAASSI